ncbi:hypothetical protein QWA68_005741 [Fusarium oxysporum]|nr:hypothetical protein QWA68_005741 [Fusarium oxysporum]
MARPVNFVDKGLVKLHTYDPETIYLFLKDVAQNPESFGIDNAVAKKDKLQTIYKLCPLDKNQFEVVKADVEKENFEPRNGNKADTNFEPRQHIYRKPTGDTK